MNKEKLITKKINYLKDKGYYCTDIKYSIRNMIDCFDLLKCQILNGDYRVKNNLNNLICYAVNTVILKQYQCVRYDNIIHKFEELEKLLIKKNADYGNSFDKTLDEYGISIGLVRIEDKINRFNNLKDKEQDKNIDEDLKDTVLDIAGYGVLLSIYLDNFYKEA